MFNHFCDLQNVVNNLQKILHFELHLPYNTCYNGFNFYIADTSFKMARTHSVFPQSKVLRSRVFCLDFNFNGSGWLKVPYTIPGTGVDGW